MKRQIVSNSKRESKISKRQRFNGCEFILGDCVEELKKIPDRSVDLVILDPPYWKVVNEHWDYKWRTESDYAKWCFKWLSDIARVIRLGGSLYLFGFLRNLVYLYKDILDLGFTFRQEIIIDKGIKVIAGRATRGYKMFPNVVESLWFFAYDSKPFIKKLLLQKQKKLGLTAYKINKQLRVKANGGGLWSLYTGNNILAQVPTREMWGRLQKVLKFKYPYGKVGQTFNIEMGKTNVWSDINFNHEKRHHPTQKPVQLIERIVKASSDKGMVVLDPFMGAGSTALSCKRLKRKFIGIEKEKRYFSIAVKRIKEL